MNKKKIFAILIVILMFIGAFTVLTSLLPPNQSSNNNSPELASIGETSSNTINIISYVNSSVANSGSSTIDLKFTENGSQNSVSFSGSQLSISSGTASGSVNLPSYYYWSGSTIGGFGVILPLPTYASSVGQGSVACSDTVGTVSMTLSGDGQSSSWSHTFNTAGGSDPTGYIEVYPSFSFGQYMDTSFTLSISISSDSAGSMQAFESSNSGVVSYSAPDPHSASISSNSVVVTSSSPPGQSSVNFATGWHFVPTTASFSIPQYESSFDVSWSSASSTNPQYNGQSPTGTSGTLTGSLTSNSITVNPKADPSDVTSSGKI